MIDEVTYDELDRYFHAAMNADEKSAFESRMNSNAELRAEHAWLNTMLGGMKQQGRSVMKQTIASAIAGIPAGQVAKYKPSVNGKSFLKKWWWAITSVAVAVVVAVGVYKYVTRHVDPVNHEGNDSQEIIPATDSTAADSCIDVSAPGATSDSTSKSMELIEGDVQILYGNDSIKIIEGVAKRPKVDTTKGYAWDVNLAPLAGVTQVQLPQQGTRLENMKTSISRRTQPPYTYTLGQNLILNANYTTTAGFQFQGAGDTIYMTDNAGLRFRLVPTTKEQPLVPINSLK